MSKSNYLENKILDHVLKNTAYTPPTTVYVALYTSDPGEGGAGSEVAGGSYARQSVNFNTASGGSTANSAQVSFADLPSATITHAGILDASSSGNLLYSVALTSPITVTSGSTVNFPAGALTVTEE